MGSLAQSSIVVRTALRVPFRQPLRSPCRNSAPFAQWKVLRTDFSAGGDSRQTPVVSNSKHSDLGPVKKSYSICLGMKGYTHHKHNSLIVDRHLLRHLLFRSTSGRVVTVMSEPCSPRRSLVYPQEVHQQLRCLQQYGAAAIFPQCIANC